MAVNNYCCNGKFERNILIVGQAGCGKTTFIQNIAKNNLFGELKRYSRYQKYRLQWKGKYFKYPQSVDEFNMELTFFK